MMGFTVTGTSRLGAEPRCHACRAGAVISFDWSYAQQRRTREDVERISHFALWKALRRGSLYRCGLCNEVWHLDGDSERMTHVGDDRLALVLAWNRAPIHLPQHLAALVEQIGPTPPDLYGNGRQRRVTPCAVETKSGETFETAMISVQRDAPFEDYIRFRLGNEIARIHDSPFALPQTVREASSRAEEMRMGFSPTLIEMPDERRFVMNGMTSFMVVPGYDAHQARVVHGSFFDEDPPPTFVEAPGDLEYFIVDGDPGWVSEAPIAASPNAVVG